MGFLKSFFVEEVHAEPDYPVDIPIVDEVESAEPVSLDEFGADTLIQDIYKSAGIDNPNGIFKVEEVAGNLPKETPKAVKKATTLSMLNSFGISIESVMDDGAMRSDALSKTLDGIVEDTRQFVESSEAEIENYKVKISELEQAIAKKKEDTDSASDKIVAEKERIADLMNFIGGDCK